MAGNIQGRDADVVSTWILNADQYKKELKELAKDIRETEKTTKDLDTVNKKLGGSFDAATKKLTTTGDAVDKLTRRFLTLELAKKVARELDQALDDLGKRTIANGNEANSAAASYVKMKGALSGVGESIVQMIDQSRLMNEVFKFGKIYADELARTFYTLTGQIGRAALAASGMSSAEWFKNTQKVKFAAMPEKTEADIIAEDEASRRALGIGEFRKGRGGRTKARRAGKRESAEDTFDRLTAPTEELPGLSDVMGAGGLSADEQLAQFEANQKLIEQQRQLDERQRAAIQTSVWKQQQLAKEREATELTREALQAHTDAISLNAATALVEGKNIGKAVMLAVKARLKGIAVMSVIDAGREVALGIGALAVFNYKSAGEHFASAAKHVVVAGLAGGGAALAGAAAGGGGGGGGTSIDTSQPGAQRPFAPTKEKEKQQNIVINLQIDKADPSAQLFANRKLRAALAAS